MTGEVGVSKQRSWIKIGLNGTFQPNGAQTSSAADLDALFKEPMGDPARLLLHIHGGLVPETAGVSIADAMMAHYDGTTRSIGLVWKTGLLETIRGNLAQIGNTRSFKKALSWVLTKALSELADDPAARGAAQAKLTQPAIEAQLGTSAGVKALDKQLVAAVDSDPDLVRSKGGGRAATDEALEETLALELQGDVTDLQILVDEESDRFAKSLDQAIRTESEAEGLSGSRGLSFTVARLLAKTILAVIRRYRNGTHHDLLPTAVEELLRAAHLAKIGVFAWGEMKEKAEAMWHDDGDTPGPTGHVGGYILRKLEKLQKDNPDTVIDLVGHSAGSIVICAMLRAIAAQGRKIRFRNILFLAPAVRLDTFCRDLAPPAPGGPFQRFRMFTMTDEAEKADKLVGAIYPRSLLFLVSGLFEDRPGTALAGMARHIAMRTPPAGDGFDAVRQWLDQNSRLVLSPTKPGSGSGLQTEARRHGDFDNDKPTLASLLHLAGIKP